MKTGENKRMSKLETFVSLLKTPGKMVEPLGKMGLLNWVPDEQYLKLLFQGQMGRKLDLENPKTFNEKLQWLKLYDRKPIYQMFVDKYEVKKYIADKIGERYVIPTLGVWDSFDQIPKEKLPDQFVLKCTHDSGGIVIVKDKKAFDWQSAKDKLNYSLKKNFYYETREWPYKHVRPRIIAEAYMEDSFLGNHELTDYKFYCFNGYVDCVMICYDRASGDTKFYFFDQNWTLKRINQRGKNAPEGFTLPKPQCIDEMFDIAAELSKGIPFLRVDLYQCNEQVYFGELTLYPQGGLDPNYLPETNRYFGDLIDLSIVQKSTSK